METGRGQVGMGAAVFPPSSSLPGRRRYQPLHPNFGELRHGSLPKQITNLGECSQKALSNGLCMLGYAVRSYS